LGGRSQKEAGKREKRGRKEGGKIPKKGHIKLILRNKQIICVPY
jgi:hypothetical protein